MVDKKKVTKKDVNIKNVSIPNVRAKLTETKFKEWCESHGFTGDIAKAYKDLQARVKK